MSDLTLAEFLVIDAMLRDNPDARVDEEKFSEIMRNIGKKPVCENCGGGGELVITDPYDAENPSANLRRRGNDK